jgi:hypothetical protein
MSDDVPDADAVLSRLGFDPDTSVLTYRQAEVLVLREHGASQAAIAERLGTSRANVSKVEASARENIEKAAETVAFADALAAPVQVDVSPGTPVFDVPDMVYEACDDQGVKVASAAAALMRRIRTQAAESVENGTVVSGLLVVVDADGGVHVREDV